MRSNWNRTKGLDQKQHQMIAVVSKYITLFMIASGSTFIAFGGAPIFNYHGLHSGMLTAVDNMINILCLFCHYSFAEKYYYRYCRRIDICCRLTMIRRLGQHDEAIKCQIAATKKAAADSRTTPTMDVRQIRFSLELNENEAHETNDNIHNEGNAEETQAMQPPKPEIKRVMSKSSDASGTGNTTSSGCRLTPGTGMSPEYQRPYTAEPSPAVAMSEMIQKSEEQRAEKSQSEAVNPVTKRAETENPSEEVNDKESDDLQRALRDFGSQETSDSTRLSDDWLSTAL